MPQFPLIKMFCSLWNVSSASQSRVFTRQKRVRNKSIIFKKKKTETRRAVFCLLFMFARCGYNSFSFHVWLAVVIIDDEDVVVVIVVTVDGFVCLFCSSSSFLLFLFALMTIGHKAVIFRVLRSANSDTVRRKKKVVVVVHPPPPLHHHLLNK